MRSGSASNGLSIRKYPGVSCVFVSLSVKAVHLKLVSDLTTEAFIVVLSPGEGNHLSFSVTTGQTSLELYYEQVQQDMLKLLGFCWWYVELSTWTLYFLFTLFFTLFN